MSVDILVGPVQQDLPEMALSVQVGIAIVIQIYPRFKFYFPLTLSMFMYDNEVKER